ncbi:hypothetical protein [Clostridium sp.]|jgi:hypothetical protein|uniref:hypothetical protein n=1 Tax=Clostridium sp. TaxID=1506 RepID=UPI0039F480A6
MKALKRIIVWILISLGLQIAVLYYVDNYFFASESVSNTIVSTKVDDEKENEKKDIDISIPEEAKNISLSYDGTYLSYYDDEVLKIVDTSTGKENNIELDDDIKVSFYRWAPDRNIMLISGKKEYNNSSKFLFYSYDAERDLQEKLETKEQDETALTSNKSAEVEDLQLSPLTNMIYIKTALKGGKSSIHNINIMKRIEKVSTKVTFIGDIRIIPNDDRIAYEGINKNRVYVTGNESAISIDGVDKLCLIDVDDNDNIYVGELEEDSASGEYNIKSIYYGTIDEDTDGWNKINLPENINKKDIYVSRSGKIYINDNLKGEVTELDSQKKIEYRGIFLQVYDGGVASISEGKLLETSLK